VFKKKVQENLQLNEKKGNPHIVVEERPLDKDIPTIEQSFVATIITKHQQMYGSVREYKVKGSDLTSILPDFNSKQNKGRLEKQDFLFRLRIDYPLVDFMKNTSYMQFNVTGFASNASTHPKDEWDVFTHPKFSHKWPTFVSRKKLIELDS